MKLYNINIVKEQFKRNNKDIKRIELEDFFTKKNVYGKYIDKFYVHSEIIKEDFITEDDLQKLILFSKMTFPISDFNFDSIQYINNDQNCKCFSISSYKDYTLKLSQYRKEEQQSLIQSEKNNVKNSVKIKNNLVTDGVSIENLLNKKILCIDFEYIDKKIINFSNCFEFGISIYNGKKIENRHYIIEDHNMPKSLHKSKLEAKFSFGDSQTIKISDIKPLLENLISDTDAILFHGHTAEMKIFASNDIKIPENVNILDPQLLKENHFKDRLHGSSLNKLLRSFRINFTCLHNSGNDSAYTMKLFLKMYRELNIKPKKKAKVSI